MTKGGAKLLDLNRGKGRLERLPPSARRKNDLHLLGKINLEESGEGGKNERHYGYWATAHWKRKL